MSAHQDAAQLFEQSVSCPKCQAHPGEPCRTVASGRKAEKSHEARYKAWNPRYKTEQRALCCRCGNLRTVARKKGFPGVDPAESLDDGDSRHPERGWRCTRTLECSVCDEPTVHATLRDDCDPRHRDHAEAQAGAK